MLIEEKNGFVKFCLNMNCTLMNIYKRLYEIGALFDVVFVSDTNIRLKDSLYEQTKIRAHRRVLSTYSVYFSKLFKDQKSYSTPLIIVVNNEDFIRLFAVIALIYGETVTVTKREFSNILNLASLLGIKPLQKVKNTSLFAQKTENMSCDSNWSTDKHLEDKCTSKEKCNAKLKDLSSKSVTTTTIEVVEALEDNIPAVMQHEQDYLIPGSDCDETEFPTADVSSNCLESLKNVFPDEYTNKTKPEMSNNDNCKKLNDLIENEIVSTKLCTTRSHQCCECNKTFAYRHTLKRHQKAIHLSDKQVCKICGKTFTWDQQLRRHAKQHASTSERIDLSSTA